jgi:sigma-E factor negative regulatory protein RseA
MVKAGNVAQSGDALMTDAVKEQASACLDGELPAAELALLVKRAERDAELRGAIGRYALIGEALRSEEPVAASRDFAAGVMAAIAQEPGRPAARIPSALLRRLRPVAGVAVAAGVAAVAILSVQQESVQPQTVAANQSAPALVSTPTMDSNSYVVPDPSTVSAPAFVVPAARLTNYVVAHSEYSSPLGRRSVLTGVLADDAADRAPLGADAANTESPPQER